jgi:hypothetical protein
MPKAMLAFLKADEPPVSYCITLPFCARKWMLHGRAKYASGGVRQYYVYGMAGPQVWLGYIPIGLECGSTLTLLPCFGYIVLGGELFATFPQSIRNMLPSERGRYSSGACVPLTTMEMWL